MTIKRLPSAIRSGTGDTRSFLSGDTSKDRADGHAETGEVAFPENIASHDFACREYVGTGVVSLAQPLNLSALVDLYPEIGKRDSRPQWIAVKRWRVDTLRPMGFWRLNAAGEAIIQSLMIKGSGLNGLIEFRGSVFKHFYRQSESHGQLGDTRRGNWGKYRRHKAPRDF